MRPLLVICCLFLFIFGCESGPKVSKTDAELHLTPQQASGRRVFNATCAQCHEAYVDTLKHGPSLQGVFRKAALPSGTPANDDRVRETIAQGRAKMPPFGSLLAQEQMDDVIAYLHTL